MSEYICPAVSKNQAWLCFDLSNENKNLFCLSDTDIIHVCIMYTTEVTVILFK